MHALPWGVVAVALFGMAVAVYLRQRASRVAVLFSVLIAFVATWHIGFAAMLAASDARTAALFGRIAIAAVAMLPAAMYEFTATALRLNRRNLLRVLWPASTAFAALTLLSNALLSGVAQHPWGWYPVAGRIAWLFLLYFFGALLAHLVEGIREYRRSADHRRRRRVAKLVTAYAIVYLASVDFLPMFRGHFPPVGYLAILLFLLFAWGTIRRHRMQPVTAARASREILDTMADALFVLDARGCIRVVNGAVTTLLGYPRHEILGRAIESLDADQRGFSAELARDQERVLCHRDGSHVDVSVSISPVDEEDVERGAVVIARDIRARKRAEAELRSAMKRLEQSNRELEDFAHIASHDLQEPLRKIQAFGDLLESKHAAVLPPQAVDYIERMRGAARRMQVLINDLLTFSRVETKGQPFVPVDLTAVAREVAQDLEVRTHEAQGRIEIDALTTIDADPLQMRQLLQNLAGNALKFRRDDVPPVVHISAAIEGELCRIHVTDNGIGFEEKYAERIFTMFERLHGRGRYDGTGIGLAICRRIAERHRGTVVARSTPGQGSTFTVTLPARQEETKTA